MSATGMQPGAPAWQSSPEWSLRGAIFTLRRHWPEYLMEAAGLGLFMISACAFGVLLEHPMSPLQQAMDSPFMRRVLMGVAMGLTAIGIICSRWGKRSGAHLNPAFTFAFWMLGKVTGWDALFYIGSQFAGGIAGVWLAYMLLGDPLRHSAVNFVVTMPGPGGPPVALLAELLISMLLMGAVLCVSNSKWGTRFTPLLAGTLLALYITFEAPLSGMSINPARTFGSALSAQEWTALWVYFIGPPAGMIVAAAAYRAVLGSRRVFCAKLHHHNAERCIFRCNYGALQ